MTAPPEAKRPASAEALNLAASILGYGSLDEPIPAEITEAAARIAALVRSAQVAALEGVTSAECAYCAGSTHGPAQKDKHGWFHPGLGEDLARDCDAPTSVRDTLSKLREGEKV